MLALPPNLKTDIGPEPLGMCKEVCGLNLNVGDVWKQAPFTAHLNVFIKKITRPFESSLLGEGWISLNRPGLGRTQSIHGFRASKTIPLSLLLNSSF